MTSRPSGLDSTCESPGRHRTHHGPGRRPAAERTACRRSEFGAGKQGRPKLATCGHWTHSARRAPAIALRVAEGTVLAPLGHFALTRTGCAIGGNRCNGGIGRCPENSGLFRRCFHQYRKLLPCTSALRASSDGTLTQCLGVRNFKRTSTVDDEPLLRGRGVPRLWERGRIL